MGIKKGVCGTRPSPATGGPVLVPHTPYKKIIDAGGDLLSHTLPSAVPSALVDLASGFGMGPGVTPPLTPPTKTRHTNQPTPPQTRVGGVMPDTEQ